MARPAFSKEEEARRYRELMGKEAADRQEDLAAQTCRACGGQRGNHHPACRVGWKSAQQRERRAKKRTAE